MCMHIYLTIELQKLFNLFAKYMQYIVLHTCVNNCLQPRNEKITPKDHGQRHILVNNNENDRRDGRTRRICKQPLADLKEKRRYWKLKEESLDRTICRTRFGRGYGPVVRQSMR